MRYEPIKDSLNAVFKAPCMRKTFYFLLDILLLRAWHVRHAMSKIEKALPKETSALDAGSGLGQYVWRMARRNPLWHITGVDINEEQVNNGNIFIAKTNLSDRVSFEVADLSTYKKSDAYDFILSVDVMEHILEDEKVFANFFASMRENGFLLISTPSDKGGSDVHDDDEDSFIEEHVRNGYGKQEIAEKLERAGFKDIKAKYTYGVPGQISWRLSMKIPIALLNISKWFFILLPFYYVVVFPFALILNALDVALEHKSGTGLLIEAKKR